MFEMLTKNDVFFTAASCKKDIIFVGISNKFWLFLFRLGFSLAHDNLLSISVSVPFTIPEKSWLANAHPAHRFQCL